MPCAGASADHCCYLAGVPCPNLRDDGPEAARRWVCTLREAAGSWEAAYLLPGYAVVRARWDEIGMADCGDWPLRGDSCAVCGVAG